jgi:hypothetical protein
MARQDAREAPPTRLGESEQKNTGAALSHFLPDSSFSPAAAQCFNPAKRRSPRSSFAVRRENVILGRHSRMAREAATDGAGRIGLERVRRGNIVKHGVRPSLRVWESLTVLLDEENVL